MVTMTLGGEELGQPKADEHAGRHGRDRDDPRHDRRRRASSLRNCMPMTGRSAVGRAELHRSPALRRHEPSPHGPGVGRRAELLTDDVTGVRELDLDDARIRTRSGWPGVR